MHGCFGLFYWRPFTSEKLPDVLSILGAVAWYMMDRCISRGYYDIDIGVGSGLGVGAQGAEKYRSKILKRIHE